jgi:hypothetical protein
MEPILVSANEALVAIARESMGPPALVTQDCSLAVAGRLPMGSPVKGVTDNEDAIARNQAEITLCVSPRMRDVLDLINAASLIDATLSMKRATADYSDTII